LNEGARIRVSEPVSEKDLLQMLKWIRGLRAWAVKNNIDPWAVRQGLIIALEMDTYLILNRGIPLESLKEFDRIASYDAKMWIIKNERNITPEIIERLKKELGI